MFFAAGLAVYPKQESKAAAALPVIIPLPPAAGAALPDATLLAPTTVSAAAQKAPVASTKAAPAVAASVQPSTGPLSPTRLSIPSIGFNNPIVKVGVNGAGEMDVPSGSTNNVGWYKNGTFPGEIGSAVIGAHVFAAFEKLDQVKPGSEVTVTMSDGSKKKFVVESATVYKLSDMSAEHLFNQGGARRLKLITCAGSLTADGSTYTHRLVVSAVAA